MRKKLSTSAWALIVVIGVLLVMEILGVYLHTLTNPLVMIAVTVVTIGLLLPYRAS
jgi:uncharacterized membrane protein HdeD (DUF308 family)